MCSFKPAVDVDFVIDANADVDLNPRPLLERESNALTTQLSAEVPDFLQCIGSTINQSK